MGVLSTVDDKITEFMDETEYLEQELSVFLHPTSHHDLQNTLAAKNVSVDERYSSIDVIPDRFVDEGDAVVLPRDVRAFRNDVLLQDEPTLHHLRDVIAPPEQIEGKTPRDSIIQSSVLMEVTNITTKFRYERIADMDLVVREIETLGDAVANPESVSFNDDIDADVYTEDGTPIWEIDTDFDDLVENIPVRLAGIGDIDAEHATVRICEEVLGCIDDTLSGRVIGWRYEKFEDGELVDHSTDPDEIDDSYTRNEYRVGTKEIHTGSVYMRNPEQIDREVTQLY